MTLYRLHRGIKESTSMSNPCTVDELEKRNMPRNWNHKVKKTPCSITGTPGSAVVSLPPKRSNSPASMADSIRAVSF